MRSSVQERCVSVYFVLIPRVSFRFYAQVPISRMAHDSIRRFQPDPVSFLSSRAPRIWIRGPGVWGSAWFLETGAELRITWLVWFILAGRDRTQRPILNCRSVARAPRHLLLFREGRGVGWTGVGYGGGWGRRGSGGMTIVGRPLPVRAHMCAMSKDEWAARTRNEF